MKKLLYVVNSNVMVLFCLAFVTPSPNDYIYSFPTKLHGVLLQPEHGVEGEHVVSVHTSQLLIVQLKIVLEKTFV